MQSVNRELFSGGGNDRFVAATPGFLLSMYLAASASEYSSPMYVPFSSTIAKRSASGSCANPTAAESIS